MAPHNSVLPLVHGGLTSAPSCPWQGSQLIAALIVCLSFTLALNEKQGADEDLFVGEMWERWSLPTSESQKADKDTLMGRGHLALW